MTPENFCYWLQGWVELQDPKNINELQIQEVKNHLKLVFDKVTPNLNGYQLYTIPSGFPLDTKHVYITC